MDVFNKHKQKLQFHGINQTPIERKAKKLDTKEQDQKQKIQQQIQKIDKKEQDQKQKLQKQLYNFDKQLTIRIEKQDKRYQQQLYNQLDKPHQKNKKKKDQ